MLLAGGMKPGPELAKALGEAGGARCWAKMLRKP